MKSLVVVLAAVAAYFAFSSISKQQSAAVSAPPQIPPVDDLAHKLQDAWADHHTVV